MVNGTGAYNQATDTAAALTKLGFQVTGTGTAAPVGHEAETVVTYAKRTDADEAAAQLVARSLSGSVIMAYGPTTGPADVTVTTGTNFSVNATAPSPTTTAPPTTKAPAASGARAGQGLGQGVGTGQGRRHHDHHHGTAGRRDHRLDSGHHNPGHSGHDHSHHDHHGGHIQLHSPHRLVPAAGPLGPPLMHPQWRRGEMSGSDAAHPVSDDAAMRLALAEAAGALEHGDVPVGAVVLAGGRVLAARHNERERRGDPTAHAEILALGDAARSLGTWRLSAVTMVVTLEPCPMCAGALVAGRAGRLVFGAADPKAGAAGSLYNLCCDPRLNHELPVTAGVLAEECGELLRAFFAGRRTG